MAKAEKRKNGTSSARYLGTYAFSGGRNVPGELNLDGANTLLKLHSDEPIPPIDSHLDGIAYTGECLTLVECRSPGVGESVRMDGPIRYHADVFPHFVTIGPTHLDPNAACITSIRFSTTDLATVFYDFDAFGSCIDSKGIIDALVADRRKTRKVDVGDSPIIQYFTGKTCIAEVETSLGKVFVRHCPRFSSAGSKGAYIKNRIVVSIEPDHPTHFADIVDRMYTLNCFLSMAAGRAQGIKDIHISIGEMTQDIPLSLEVHMSFRPRAKDKNGRHKPHPGDVPLDPIRFPTEFNAVLTDWVHRHDTWEFARSRYLAGLRNADMYAPDRLVAAANMFDILPTDAVPSSIELSPDLAATRDRCITMFREHPVSIDRNSGLSALGRLGRPSLPKKVAHRVSIVEARFGKTFPDLLMVAYTAVKCRNYLVHGSDDLDYQKVEPFVPFLTDALEFIFAASDFIDAGWDATRWNQNGHSWGHTFARFRWDYAGLLNALKNSLAS
jgi:hypothetical protein